MNKFIFSVSILFLFVLIVVILYSTKNDLGVVSNGLSDTESLHSGNNRILPKVTQSPSDSYGAENGDKEEQEWYNGVKVRVDINPDPSFVYEKYEDQAIAIKEEVLYKLDSFKSLEKEKGVVSLKNPDGSKHIVDIYNKDDVLIGKLVYIGSNIHQLIEYKEDKMNGVNAFFNIKGNPHKIYHFKDGALEGPFFQFIKRGENEGDLISYIEYKDGNFEGKKLAWTLDRKVIEGSKVITMPVPASLFP